MIVWLALTSLFAGSLVAHEAGTRQTPVAICEQWIAKRPAKGPAPELRALSPEVACFDGAIGPVVAKEILAWTKRPTPIGAHKSLVVRSGGGNAADGLAIAEALQRAQAHVYVTQLCASSCANYLFAGVRDRHALGRPAVLFHGGFSAQTRTRAVDMFDMAVREDAGRKIKNAAQQRARIVAEFDANWERQRALYLGVSVKDAVVEVDRVDADSLPAATCGRSDRTRDFLFFDRRQMRRLGLSLRSGRVATTPQQVQSVLDFLGGKGTACRAPDSLLKDPTRSRQVGGV